MGTWMTATPRSTGRRASRTASTARGEDLFAQVCMDKHGVKKVENFEISTDGACPGDRPKDQQKNKKWIPPCAGTVTPSIHPFKKPADWKKCYDETNGRQTYGN